MIDVFLYSEFNDCRNPINILISSRTSECAECDSEMKANRDAISSCVSTSAADPSAILTNCENSFFDRRAAPSAIFEGMETAARLICDVSPNRSSAGNDVVKR